jgi:hypothetical protein
LPYQVYNQDFAIELEKIFKYCINDVKIFDVLEHQELTLGRLDYAEERIDEKLILDHVSNYPAIVPKKYKNNRVDMHIDH